MREQALVLGEVGDEALDGTADHGVLAHQDDTLAAHRLTDLVHLLRRDIVDGDNEDGLVLLEESLELVKVDGFGCGLAPHVCDLSTRIGMFQAKSKSELLVVGSKSRLSCAFRRSSNVHFAECAPELGAAWPAASEVVAVAVALDSGLGPKFLYCTKVRHFSP